MRFFEKHCGSLFALLLTLTVLFGIGVFRLPALPKAFVPPEELQMHEFLEPEPEPEPAAILGAVTILADKNPICTLINEAEAMALLRYELVQAFIPPQGEMLHFAAFVKQLELRYAKPDEEPMLLSRAKGLLKTNADLCPVIYTTRSVFEEALEYERTFSTDTRIPKNARLVNALGKPGIKLTVTETTYVNKMPSGSAAIVKIELINPCAEKVSKGAFKPGNAGGTPSRHEGEKGPKAPSGFSLALPVKGNISSNFGMRSGSMHYGLDIDAKPGAALTAPEGGRVIFARERSSYGFVLEVEHAEGFVTRLAPVADCLLKLGELVDKGQQLGVLGMPSDEEAKPHLHMELLIGGIPYNPRQYLK